MIFDLTSERDINIANKRLMIVMDRLDALLSKKLKPLLLSYYKDTAEAINKVGIIQTNTNRIVEKQSSKLRLILREHYLKCASIFSGIVFEELNLSKSITKEEEQGKRESEEFWLLFIPWLKVEVKNRTALIDDYTVEQLDLILKKSKEEGKSEEQILKLLLAAGLLYSFRRAKSISLTETHIASLKAIDQAVDSSRVKTKKVWSTIIDRRERESHRAANNQTRERNELFDVDGEKLMFPGDTRNGATAKNIVNCRCVLRFYRL